MALVATYGNVSAFNIQIYDMAGGGYYVILCDGNTQVFQRRNASGGQDSTFVVGGVTGNFLDHFLSYSYDSVNKILTLSGAVDIHQGITFTRQEVYKFISNYIVEDTWTVTANITGGATNFTNWCYYLQAINAIWNIDNTNFGDGSSTKPLGIGVQLTNGGSIYGVIADNMYQNNNNDQKRALASQSGIAATWISSNVSLNENVNYSLSLRQWYFTSTNTLYDFMLQSEIAVATVKGYTGSLWDKICQVNAYLNINKMADNISPMIIPSNNYVNSGTYMRDGFWQSLLIDSSLEQNTIREFENNQDNTGNIPEHINRNNATFFHQTDSALLYLIRAYYDKFIRGLTINLSVAANALTYIFSQVVSNQYQTDSTDSGHLKTWMDGFIYTTGTYNGYNQGLYCVALKCAQKLGLHVSNEGITNAITQYQALYDSNLTFIKFASDKSFLSPDVLVGEALSIFLFSQKMLTNTQVNNHIASIETVAQTQYGAKIICDSTGAYINTNNFSGVIAAGDYQNGGSWFLYEYLAYYAGLYHGYPRASQLINNRINIELTVDPVSHEYLQTSGSLSTPGSESAQRHVYSWNAMSYVVKQKKRLPTFINRTQAALARNTMKTRSLITNRIHI